MGTPNNPQELRTQAGHLKHLDRIKARNKRIALLAVSACLCLTLLVAIGTGLYFLLQEPEDDGRIIAGVQVGGINIGGMTPDEATDALQVAIVQPLSKQDMVVELPGATLTLSPQDTKVSLDLEALVSSAYALGRSGSTLEMNVTRSGKKHIIPLLPYLELDTDYIRSSVEAFADGYSIFITQPTATVEGERPTYVEDQLVVHQVLTITIGTPQFVLDAQDLYDSILDAYSLFDLSPSYEAPHRVEPDPVDLQAIYDEFCVLPVDAVLDPETFEVTPEIVGYGFDMDALQRLIDDADYGDRVQIQMDFLMPDITAQTYGELFQSTLGSFVSNTTDSPDENRDNNIHLSCEAINGYVIKSGESFDFNRVLGPQTTDKGYLSAPTYSGSGTYSVGGGVAQTASALYYSALLAGLQIDEQHYHRYTVSYTPIGTDAAISYGSQNLVFTNNTPEPIRVTATYEQGRLTVTLLGTETRDYNLSVETEVLETIAPGTMYQYMTQDNVFGYVDGQVLETAVTGYVVRVYLVQRSLSNGEELSRQELTTVTYEKRDSLVVKIENTNS